MKVIILRGPPGCGKSDWAKKFTIKHGGSITSADTFFTLKGRYDFDPALLPEAHAACFRWFLQLLSTKTTPIVVDNTNMRIWQFANYSIVAELLGYEVVVATFMRQDLPLAEAVTWARRNVHNVPLATVGAMFSQYEPFDDEIHISRVAV